MRKEELRKAEERRALEQRDEEKRQTRQEDQRLVEQLEEQSRQSPAKSHHSHQSDSITPKPRLEGLEGQQERLAPKRDLFLGPIGAQVETTKMATFSPEKCISPSRSPAGRCEMHRLDDTVSDEVQPLQPTLRVGTLQSFDKEQKISEKVEPQIWQTTSLWEEIGPRIAQQHP